jgi:hypothetical protein
MSRTLRLVATDDRRVDAVTAALASHAWQSFTAEAVSRRAIAALEPHWIEGMKRVARQDERIMVLTRFLAGCEWRSLTAAGLSRHLVSVLDAWRQESQCWRSSCTGIVTAGEADWATVISPGSGNDPTSSCVGVADRMARRRQRLPTVPKLTPQLRTTGPAADPIDSRLKARPGARRAATSVCETPS